MKGWLVASVVVLLAAGAAVLAYQAVARDREYGLLINRGDEALHDEQTFVAIEAYSGAIALRPDSMLAHLRRGETYQHRGELEAAARDFRAAAALDPTATRPLEALGDTLYQRLWYERAVDAYQASLRLDDRSPRVTQKLALARYRAGNIDGALAAATQTVRLLDQSSRSSDAYYVLGLCLREKHRVREAQEAFETAVALSPALIPAREELAELYASVGQHAHELEQLRLLASLDRERVERQVALARAQARGGQSELAVLTLERALDRAPDHPLVYAALGRIWIDLAEADGDPVDLNKAIDALERVASSFSASSDVVTLYGRALIRSGQFELAEGVLQRAIERYPVEPTAFLYYAIAAERQRHLFPARQALIDYNALVRDDADVVPNAARIATLSLQMNDAATAVDWLERAVDRAPGDLTLVAALADAQLKDDDKDDARTTIARGLEKDPEDPALLALARRVH